MRSQHSPPPLPTTRPLEQANTPRWHGSVIVASLAVALVFVMGVFTWIVVHPHKARSEPPATTAASLTASSPVITGAPAALPPPPAAPAIELTLVKQRVENQEGLIDRLPLLEESPPPLPSPVSAEPKGEAKAAAPQQPAGEKYGTEVLFLNNSTVAGDKARDEKKLLFVMHISGNFEDSCFT